MIRPRVSRPSTEGRRGTSSRRRRRILVSALTLFMLLSATAVAQSGNPPTDADVTSQPVRSSGPQPHLARWWQSIGWGILLLVILVASVSAIVLFSRRFKKYLWPESREPTPSEDVWTMHKLTDSDDTTEDDEDTDTSPGAN